ncbi:MAG: hypothetical protein RJB37_800 [Pseudomonadota bacterium]
MSCVASPIQRVHHSAYRCRDSGATRTGRATETLHTMRDKGRAQGVDTRGIVDHGLFESLYFRDPNGYVVELCCPLPGHDEGMDPSRNRAREKLDGWLARRVGGA